MNYSELKKKTIKYTILCMVVLILFCVGYLYIVLKLSYSKGERIGYIQKFSEKGWLCKTHEGELQMLPVPGALPEKFLFSVRDPSIMAKINSSMGKKISINYEQHIGIPTQCFGETEYYVVGVRVLE